MKKLLITLLLLTAGTCLAANDNVVLDSNTAFYEGQVLRYTIPAPRNFRLVINEAYADGYSMAFIPRYERYDSASVMIAVNIYKTGGMTLDSVIGQDTVALREHFGAQTSIREVAPLVTGNNLAARTFYLKNDKDFVPNAAIAYFDGGSEVLIFELIIEQTVLRFKAEQLFSDFVRNFKPMKRGTLGSQ